MKIILDGYNLGLEHGTGVATYGRNLSHTLHGLGHEVGVLYGEQSTHSSVALLKEVAFFDASPRPRVRGWHGIARMLANEITAPLGCAVDHVPAGKQVVADAFATRLPYFDTLYNSTNLFRRALGGFKRFRQFSTVEVPHADIVHWTYPLPVRDRKAANIYTLHDLVPLKLPHTTLDNKRAYYALCKRLVDRGDHIVTVSETSRRDIIELLGAPPEKVTNTYQSVTFSKQLLEKSDATVESEVRGIFGFPYRDYFLYFGAVEPKKDLGRLIEAYLSSMVTTPLVIVGAPGWKSREELRLLDSLHSLPHGDSMRRQIIQLKYLPRPLLVSLIRGAKATFFPSLYEGFGLPAVESMLLGTPVLTSNGGSLGEICGDAALQVNPYDTVAMAAAIRQMDADADLRAHWVAQGYKQAALFSDEACSARIEAVYQQFA